MFGMYRPPDADFRGNQCPARAAGLAHTSDPEDNSRCVHCGKYITKTPPAGVPETASEAQRVHHAEVFDHHYVFTLTGRCGFKNCGKFNEQHAAYRLNVEEGDCTVDHKSVKPWTECAVCHETVEPKMVEGRLGGPGWGLGRLPFTRRHFEQLDRIREAWLGGYFKS